MSIKAFSRVALAVAGMLFSAQSSALLITNLNDPTGDPPGDVYSVGIGTGDIGVSFTVDWLMSAGTTNSEGNSVPYDLQAQALFSIDSFSSSELVLSISITNLTDLTGYSDDNAAILSFGFGVEPDVTATFADSGQGAVFQGIGSGSGPQQTYPGGFKGIDVCVFTHGCSGGNVNTGLQASLDGAAFNSDLVKLSLAGTFGSDPYATLAFFPIKFQGTYGSFELPGTPTNGEPPTPPLQIPEPGLLVLFGTGLMALGWAIRRRQLLAGPV